ncbi:hypothetical protein ACRYGW_04890 [Mycobacteroides abscessus]
MPLPENLVDPRLRGLEISGSESGGAQRAYAAVDLSNLFRCMVFESTCFSDAVLKIVVPFGAAP